MNGLETPAATARIVRPAFLPGNRDASSGPAPRRSRLWLWFVAAFVLQLSVWAAWFVIAAHHKVAEVPLVRTDRR